MPVGLSKRPETAIREATEEHPRTHWRNVRYHNHHVEDGELLVEVGTTDDGGVESITNYADAVARAVLDLADGRTANITLVTERHLARLTVGESMAGLADDELRQRVLASIRID